MRTPFAYSRAFGLCALVLACDGSVEPGPTVDTDRDPVETGAPAPDETATDSAPSDTGEPPVVVGIDERPSNTTCLAGPRPNDGTATLAVEPVFEDVSFAQPIAAIRAPGEEGRWFVVELKKQIHTFLESDPGGTLDTSMEVVDVASTSLTEWGMLSMALHPDYPADPRAFLYYTSSEHSGTVLASVEVGEGGLFSSETLTELLVIDQRDDVISHVGAHIAFHPTDGTLFLALGDGGDGASPDVDGAAQDNTDLRGAILRIDVDGGTASVPVSEHYGVPADNPFADGEEGRPEIYAWGFRNPWRFSFDRETGDLWVGDVGQNCWEEIDRVERGGNYGWSLREGAHDFDIDLPDDSEDKDGCGEASKKKKGEATDGLIDPVVEYVQEDGNNSVTGGYVYRGSEIPALYGRYLYADYGSGRFWGLSWGDDGEAVSEELLDSELAVVSFTETPDGELYILGYEFWTGSLYRLVAAEQTEPTDPWPESLVDSGCVDPLDPTQPPEGAIPYGVNVPVWGDGATITRWLALPDGSTIAMDEDGDWTLPDGSVSVLHLELDAAPVETRVLARHDDGSMAAYTYAWLEDSTDATLVSGGRSEAVGGHPWRWQASNECLACHSDAAGRTLGLETAQLNRDMDYGDVVADQLTTLQHIGLFSEPLGEESAALPSYPTLDDEDASAEDRARAYLHANCSGCHRPGGPGRGPMDFRITVPLEDASICDATPEHGDLDLEDARIVAPGAPERSVLSARVHAEDVTRMPPLRVTVDTEAASVIDTWIEGLEACP